MVFTYSTSMEETGPNARTVIAIAGGSCSGKTTLAKALAVALGETFFLSTDRYYRDQSHVPMTDRISMNFDHPDAVEHELLITHVSRMARGETVHVPRYDYSTHARLKGTESCSADRFLIVEGLYAMGWPELRALARLNVFVELDHAAALERRIERDVAERGRSADIIRAQYEATVRPMYEEHVAPLAIQADEKLPGDAAVEIGVTAIMGRLGLSLT